MSPGEMRAYARGAVVAAPPLTEETRRAIRRALKQCPPVLIPEGIARKDVADSRQRRIDINTWGVRNVNTSAA